MSSMSRVRSCSWIAVPILTALAAACVENQPAEPTVTGIALARGGGGGEPTVDGTQPPGAPQGKTLDVQVFGSSFDQGSNAAFTIDGIPGRVHTNSTRFVSRSELVSNITIDLDADMTLYDVEVTTSKGKKGVGADLFSVVAEGTEVYSVIYLRSLTGRGKASQSTNGSAHDITEPDANGLLRVVGGSEEWRTGEEWPVVWSGTLSTIGDAEPHLLAPERGRAAGINDAGTIIAGRVGRAGTPVPVVWMGPDWTQAPLALGDCTGGLARDVTDDGRIVGWLHCGADTVAAVWPSPGAQPQQLVVPGFQSQGNGLNNQGYIAGRIWNGSSQRAVLWRPDGTLCDLQGESLAWRPAEAADGTVIVAGYLPTPNLPTIWTVNVSDCSAGDPTVGSSPGWALDVRRVADGWEAVGSDQADPAGTAALWTSSGDMHLLHKGWSGAVVINNAGYVVGWQDYQGVLRAVLWVK